MVSNKWGKFSWGGIPYGLSSAITAQAEVTIFYLVEIGSYYYTDCDISLLFKNNTYISKPLKISGFTSTNANPLDGGTIQIGNVDLNISSLILNNLIRNTECKIYEAYLDSDNIVDFAKLIFQGVAEGGILTEMWAEITLTPLKNHLLKTFPRRRFIRQCNWTYKSIDCAYTGAIATCNKTWDDCGIHGNQRHFGGFRFLPEKGRVFTWGQTVITIK